MDMYVSEASSVDIGASRSSMECKVNIHNEGEECMCVQIAMWASYSCLHSNAI